MKKNYGAIEAGGTKFNCAIFDDSGVLKHKIRIPTKNPDNTLNKVVDFFNANTKQSEPIAAIGIGSFGPVDLNKNSPTWGYITKTPKLKWENTDFAGIIGKELNIPVAFDTDVNCATLGEIKAGAAIGLDSIVYITVGTGIGGGVIINGEPLHGITHPEIGHTIVHKHSNDVDFNGCCPFHNNCLEGMASGPSIKKRWGTNGEKLPESHISWDIEAYYLSQGIVNIILTLCPEKIILGGGVMSQMHLFPKIRKSILEMLNSYLSIPQIIENIDSYVVPPGLENNSGIYGAFYLAKSIISS